MSKRAAAEFAEVDRYVSEMTTLMNELLDGLAAIRRSREQIEALLATDPDAEALHEAGDSAIERLTAWEHKVVQVDYETYEDEDNLPPSCSRTCGTCSTSSTMPARPWRQERSSAWEI